MKKFLIIILVLFISSANSQENLVLKNINFNQNSRLIGMYPHYDKERTFEKYNFIIEDLKVLDSLSKILSKGKEVVNQYTRTELKIRLFDGDNELKTWGINPKYSYIRVDGKSYKFDSYQILNLVKKFGFKYTFKKMTFNSEEHFNAEYEKLKLNKNLLFVYKPNFKFSGKFEVKFLKSRKFKHPKAITEYLNKLITKTKKKGEFRVYYVLTKYNRKNRNQYTMTIESSSDLFQSFKDKNGIKGKWSQNKFNATVFLKK